MLSPIFVRPLKQKERAALRIGLRSSEAFVLRRCQIIRQSAEKRIPRVIAESVGLSDQAVRNVIHQFNQVGLQVLQKNTTRPATRSAAFTPANAERLRVLLPPSPRTFGKPTSLWTLELAAEVSWAQGLTATQVTGETVRATLARLNVRWTRAKRWITSPDPAYVRKKKRVIV